MFRFYGRDPGDWFETAKYEVKFERQPTPEERIEIARRLQRRLGNGPAELLDSPMMWSGPFVLFDTTTRWPGTERAAFTQIAEALIEVARALPIAQVINFGAREHGNGGWDRATRERQPVPDAGPAWPRLDLRVCAYPRPVDAGFPEGVVDDAVEETRRGVRRARQEAKARAAVAKASTKTPMSPFPAERVAAFDAAQPGYGPETLAAFQVPNPAKATFGGGAIRPFTANANGDHPVYREGRPCAVMYREGYPRGVAYLDDAGVRREVEGLPPLTSPVWRMANLIGPWVTDDGHGLWIAHLADLYRVDIATAMAQPVMKTPVADVAFVADGRWVIATKKSLLLVDPSTWTVIDNQKTAVAQLTTVFGGELVLGVDFLDKKRLEVWTVMGDKLKRLTMYAARLGGVREIDGEVVCNVFGTHDHVTLDGLDEVLARTRKTKGKSKTKKAPRDTDDAEPRE